MANDHLATYLNDHLAGSVAALKLLKNIERAYAGKPAAAFVTALRADIEEDKRELESLMRRLQVSESATRKATAWIAERVAQLKLRLDDKARGSLRLLESLEAVSLGIEGRLALWRALAAAAGSSAALKGLDYPRLMRRAEEQRSRIEPVRIDAARAAFGDGT